MVGADAALGGRLGPVVVVAEAHLGLGALADVAVLRQPVPLDLHVGLRLLVGDEKLVGTPSGFPLCVEPENYFYVYSLQLSDRKYQKCHKSMNSSL